MFNSPTMHLSMKGCVVMNPFDATVSLIVRLNNSLVNPRVRAHPGAGRVATTTHYDCCPLSQRARLIGQSYYILPFKDWSDCNIIIIDFWMSIHAVALKMSWHDNEMTMTWNWHDNAMTMTWNWHDNAMTMTW